MHSKSDPLPFDAVRLRGNPKALHVSRSERPPAVERFRASRAAEA
jgi:hypothetical protein